MIENTHVLINASNLHVGGGIQVGLSILNFLRFKKLKYSVLMSEALSRQVNQEVFPSNFEFLKPISYPRNFFERLSLSNELSEVESNLNCDIVYTVFGPAYWQPQCYHICGFAVGWCYYTNSPAFEFLSWKERFHMKTLCWLKNQKIKKVSLLLVETETAKKACNRVLQIDKERIHVIGNNTHQVFDNAKRNEIKIFQEEFNIVTVASAHKHKNLGIISKVIYQLNSMGVNNIRFHVTIKSDDYLEIFGESSPVINHGVVDVKELPALYQKMDFAFLPTLIETFSAAYPEAMKMGLPLITSSLDFAKDLCGDAALYVDPLNPINIAQQIQRLIEDKSLQIRLQKNGFQQIEKFPTAFERAEIIYNLILESSYMLTNE